jgi:peptidoglycan/xylan/chitin deacetylase (PgdA/CDA1 family)
MDGEQLPKLGPRNVDRRTLLRAGLAVVVVGATGSGLVSCTTGHKRATQASAPPELADPSTSAVPGSGSATSAASSAAPGTQASTPGESEPTASVEASRPEATGAAPTDATQAASTEAAASATPGSPAVEIVHGPKSATGVALTFHGAGDVALATKLLGELETAGARATVLAVGQWLDEEPAMAKRILNGGHELGNHTYRHLTMPPLTEVVDESEISRCADVLRRLTGSAGRWFRPSGTVHATPAILEAAGRAGCSASLSYDVDPADYTDPGPTAITERVLAAVRAGSIVSLHLGHAGTVQAMPAILDGLRSRGLHAVTMSDLMS